MKLINRGESHITVITPPEYNVLSVSGLTIKDINAIASTSNIQMSSYTPICVARYRKDLNAATITDCDKNPKCNVVYNVIVDTPDLVAIRHRINDRYQSLGGEPGLFDPDYFLPHITVGFNGGDMFDFPHGVFKGKQACWGPLITV